MVDWESCLQLWGTRFDGRQFKIHANSRDEHWLCQLVQAKVLVRQSGWSGDLWKLLDKKGETTQNLSKQMCRRWGSNLQDRRRNHGLHERQISPHALKLDQIWLSLVRYWIDCTGESPWLDQYQPQSPSWTAILCQKNHAAIARSGDWSGLDYRAGRLQSIQAR